MYYVTLSSQRAIHNPQAIAFYRQASLMGPTIQGGKLHDSRQLQVRVWQEQRLNSCARRREPLDVLDLGLPGFASSV